MTKNVCVRKTERVAQKDLSWNGGKQKIVKFQCLTQLQWRMFMKLCVLKLKWAAIMLLWRRFKVRGYCARIHVSTKPRQWQNTEHIPDRPRLTNWSLHGCTYIVLLHWSPGTSRLYRPPTEIGDQLRLLCSVRVCACSNPGRMRFTAIDDD